MKDLKQVTGSTFTHADPEAQQLGDTEHARKGDRNLSREVRFQRTYMKGVVPEVDLALATRNRSK